MTHTDDTPPFIDEEPPPWLDYQEPAPVAPTDERTPPQDLAAERAVLGGAFIHPRNLTAAAQLLTGADFYKPQHETIWRALRALHADGHPTTVAAVASLLTEQGELAGVGGVGYLFSLEHEGAPAPEAVTYWASKVDELARKRHAITQLERGLQKLRNPGPDSNVDQVLATVTGELAEARDNLAGMPTTTTWSPVDLGAVLEGEMLDPPPTMLMRTDGVFLFYDGAVHTVSGESESGKTWLTLIAVLQLVQQRHRVVFIDFEDRADRVTGRLLALGATPDEIRDHFAYIRPDRPLDDDGRAQLGPALTDAQLVILDGVTEAMTIHGFDLNSNADSALFQGLLPRWIADHGPAVVMIDHVVKNKDEQGRFAIGAQHKLAGIDGAAYMVKIIKPFARGVRGLASVDVAKDRPGHVREHARDGSKRIAELILDSSTDGLVITAHLTAPDAAGVQERETFEPTGLMEKVSRAVQLTPGMPKSAIENVVTGKAKNVRTALDLLVARGYVMSKTEGRRIAHYHVKPYYQPGQDPTDQDPDTPSEEAS